MHYTKYNAAAWDENAANNYIWTLPISHERYLEALRGSEKLFLTPTIKLPDDWLPKLKGLKVLGLASGGGQQCPIFAALGADITIFDLSDKQLKSDRLVAEREGYRINIIKGDMTEPLPFADCSFDIVFNPISNCYVKEIQPIWNECARILKKDGLLLASFAKEEVFMFEPDYENEDMLISRHPLPFNSLTDLTDEKRKEKINNRETFAFSHSLTEQIGGLLKTGFSLTDIYEDGDGGGLFDKYMKSYVAIRMVKL